MNANDRLMHEIKFMLLEMKFFSKEGVLLEISKIVNKYDVMERERSIVVYDTFDTEALKKFFISKSAQGLSQNSLNYYRVILQKFLKTVNRHIKDIGLEDIRLYILSLRLNGLSPTTQNNERRVISSFFGFLSDEGLIERNVAKGVKNIKSIKTLPKCFTEDEMEEIRSNAGNVRNLALIETLYSTGCRVSELCSLTIKDVDFERKEASIIGKGNKERKVYFSARALSAIKKYLEEWEIKEGKLFKGRNIITRQLSDLTKSGVENMLRELGKKLNLKIHPHKFRRTAATHALRRGMPMEVVSKMLGHEDLKTTSLYAQAAEEDLKNAHKKYLI